MQDVIVSAVYRVKLVFWRNEIAVTFFCVQLMADCSFLGSKQVRERLSKCLFELQFIHFNSHPQILHVTWRYFLSLCLNSVIWDSKENSWGWGGQCYELLGFGKQNAKGFGATCEVFSSAASSDPCVIAYVCSFGILLEDGFPLDVLAPFNNLVCLQVSPQELGDDGTCAFLVSCPTLTPCFWYLLDCWISLYMGLF